jgi:replicative DNA helicase
MELLLINKLLNKEHYSKYRSYIKIKKEEQELTDIYRVLDVMQESCKDITFDEFKVSVLVKYPDYSDLIDQAESSSISDDVLESAINKLIEKSKAYDLALLAIDVSEGREEFQKLKEFYTDLDQDGSSSVDSGVEFVTDDFDSIYDEDPDNLGLTWRLPSMNRMLGPLRKGNFGFIFARPETGKTSFLASEITHMAGQVERPILWFNNEQVGTEVKQRIHSAALGATKDQIDDNRAKASEAYHRKTKGNIKLVDDAGFSRSLVEAVCRQYNPSLIVFDQIDKIKGFQDDRDDLRLGKIYIWAREIAKQYCPVIGVCQSDASGEGKKWLGFENVSNAKTSKQAEADWILGIGAVHDVGLEHIRYLHLSKNKLAGSKDTDSSMRHGRVEVALKGDIARYVELGG